MFYSNLPGKTVKKRLGFPRKPTVVLQISAKTVYVYSTVHSLRVYGKNVAGFVKTDLVFVVQPLCGRALGLWRD